MVPMAPGHEADLDAKADGASTAIIGSSNNISGSAVTTSKLHYTTSINSSESISRHQHSRAAAVRPATTAALETNASLRWLSLTLQRAFCFRSCRFIHGRHQLILERCSSSENSNVNVSDRRQTLAPHASKTALSAVAAVRPYTHNSPKPSLTLFSFSFRLSQLEQTDAIIIRRHDCHHWPVIRCAANVFTY